MKATFFLYALPLFSMLYANTQAQDLRLTVSQVFTSTQEAVVNVRAGYDYRYNRNRIENDTIALNVYKPAKQASFIVEVLSGNANFNITDSVVQSSSLVKSLETSFNLEEWGDSQVSIGNWPTGIYIIEALYHSQIARVPLLISDYSLIAKKKNAEIISFVADMETGKQQHNFEIYLINENKKLPAVTKTNGLSVFDASELNFNDYYKLLAQSEGEYAVSDFYYYSYESKDDPIGLLFTDRPAYRPGQQVNFQGFIREVNGYQLAPFQDSLHVKIKDQKGKEIYKQKLVCDENGSFNDSLFLKENAPLGNYTITASFNEREYFGYYNKGITGSFRVEEYKKPEYEVLVTLDKPQYISGETFTANLKADYFFGAPVKNASVSYKIVRELYYVPWYAYYAYSWWYEDSWAPITDGSGEVVEMNTAELDKNGELQIQFTTEGKTDSNYRYRVLATVTDASRRSIVGSASTLVTATAFTLSANAEKFYYKTDEEVAVRINAEDFAKKPVSTDFELVLRPYYYQDGFDNEVSKPIYKTTAKTDENGTALIKFKVDDPGYYQLKVSAIDKNGKEVTNSNSVYVLKEGQNTYSWWKNESVEIQLLTDKKVYEAGDTINAMILAPNATDALVTLDGKRILHKKIASFNKSGEDSFSEYKIPIEKGVYGTLLLDIAYVSGTKTFTKSERITVVPSEKYLDAKITFDESSYKPSTTAKATILVTDANNKPVPNALVSLATADESIYFLYPDKTADIQKSFYPNAYTQTYTYFNNYNKNDAGKWPSYAYLKGIMQNGQFSPKTDFFVPNSSTHYLKLASFEKVQKVSGYVVDETTGKILKGVKVQAGKTKVKTNEWGYYELVNFSDTTITFSYKGSEIVFSDEYFFKKTNNGFRQAYLNVKFQSDNKKKENLILTKSYAYENNRIVEVENEVIFEEEMGLFSTQQMAFAADGGGDDWGASDDMPATTQAAFRKVAGANVNKEVKPVIRQNFKDAIYWNPKVKTNEKGEATVKITLPDNLTTWRTTAKVITPDTKVGQTFAKVVVKKDLLVRMETPRFFRIGDKLVIATTVHNYLNSRKRVRVALKANGITVKGTNKYIVISANGEERIDWEVAANWPGDATLTVEAVTNEESDAKKVTVPVQANGLEVITASSATLQSDKQTTMEIYIPEDVDLNTVSLELSTAPSVSAALLGSLDQLIGYPYGCVEQTMSRFLPTLIVANTLQKLNGNYSSGISDAELKKMTAKGLKRLGELQHNDGGWGWWETDNTHPFMTAYVVNGLVLASKTGYDISADMLEQGKVALERMLKSNTKADNTTYAYQVATAMQAGMDEFWINIKKPNVDSLNAYQTALWLQAAQLANEKNYSLELVKRLESLAIKDGSLNYWGGKKFYYSWQDDRVETTAHVVQALANQDLQHPLLSGAIQWLMQKRRGNGWHNTRQTAFTILGLQKVIASEIDPDYTLSILANGRKVSENSITKEAVFEKAQQLTLKGESFTATVNNSIPSVKGVLKHGKNIIQLEKDGEGSVYANATLTYFMQKNNERIASLKNKSIAVERDYYTLKPVFDDDGKVIYRKTSLEEATPNSGDDVLVKVKITSDEDLDYVLIEDPIPGGFEFIRDKSGYNIEGEEAYSGGDYYRSYFRWMNQAHTEYRDNRYAIVLTRLSKGVYEYSYLIKAQIPGTFEVNPALVQLMYYPEKRGFSNFEAVRIGEGE